MGLTTHIVDDLVVRLAGAEDLPAINAVYNHYVLHSTCTYQEQPEPIEGRREWFARHGAAHPVTVAAEVREWICRRETE